MAKLTTDPKDTRLGQGADETPTPQSEVYLVLPEEERAKGFTRPYRDRYQHVGERPKFTTRDLTDEEKERYDGEGYVMFEMYPDSMSPRTGKFWTQKQLESGCGVETVMSRALSETYARNPKFYGATYCTGCNMHRPVSEFVWSADGEVVGS